MFDTQNLPVSGGLLIAGILYAGVSLFATGPLIGERTIERSDWSTSCTNALESEILSEKPPAPITPRTDCQSLMGWLGRDFARVCDNHGNPEFKLPFQDQVRAQEQALYEAKERRLAHCCF